MSDITDRLENMPCLVHKKTKQEILSYNEKTGNFKVRCIECKKEGISNILSGKIKLRETTLSKFTGDKNGN